MFRFHGDKPIFLQIAENLEDGILLGAFQEEEQIPSITEIAVKNQLNPATALKGVNLLVEEGLVYKKRGIGMFVAAGAVQRLQNKRREQFFDSYIAALVEEAKRLQITQEEIQSMIERGFQK